MLAKGGSQHDFAAREWHESDQPHATSSPSQCPYPSTRCVWPLPLDLEPTTLDRPPPDRSRTS